ncbi:MAG: Rv3235 family protein [Gordonia sp. (in: high G+C Gram-positive bacteria)]|uniref:Rv3235 family protein n=1 Tax=Gordonia sp. (in: high G+C Gram-positive bacteria) TaxID=84139 RepID=UPI0039E61499
MTRILLAPERTGELQIATTVRTAAITALARTLEVLDGRRPRSQLAPCVASGVLAQITALIQNGGPDRESCARLHRVHVQLSGERAAEFFGTFARGPRVRALAGRLDLSPVRVSRPGVVPRRVEDRWVLSEFTIL